MDRPEAGGEARARSLPGVTVRSVDCQLTCAENLRRDNRALAVGAPAVRVAVLSDRTVSVGIGVPSSAPYLDRARAAGFAVERSFSGGIAVMHAAGDLAWSIVLPRDHPAVGRDYLRAYDRLGRGVQRSLADHGLATSWVPPPGLSEEYCLLGTRGLVLSAPSGIVGGAAQHRTRTALLHHGHLAMRLDREALRRIFDLEGTRGADRLSSLEDAGLRTPADELATSIAESLESALERR